MFSIYTQLNEGGCTANERKCAERKLTEGGDPKPGIERKTRKHWNASQTTANVNSHWEKLRK